MHSTALLMTAVLTLGPAVAGAQAPAPAEAYTHVRVHAHILLLDRTTATRIGLGYAQVGGGLIGVQGAPARRGSGGVVVGGEVAGMPASAFIELARDRGVLRSETRTQVLALSGAAAVVGSGTISTGRWGTTRVRGPELEVVPTVLDDGTILLDVRARLRDEVTSVYGWGMDGSPVDVATRLVVAPGQEATVGSVRTTTQRSDTGLLSWRSEAGEMDVLVVLRPEVVVP
jgi:hypothetical protein